MLELKQYSKVARQSISRQVSCWGYGLRAHEKLT
jgi:hypothetical protein